MIRKLLEKLPLLLWFVPGFLLWASFPPMGESADVFFALAPAIWFSRRNSPKRSFLCWFSNGLFFWTATLSWMPAIVKNGGPWPLVVLGWGALAAYCALYFGLFGWLAAIVWRWVRTRHYGWRLLAIFVAEPVLWAGLEIVRSRLFGGFAWNQLGVAPVNAGLGEPAMLGGVYLVSAIAVLVNGTFVSIAERMFAGFMRDSEQVGAPPRWLRSVETIVPLVLVIGVYQIAGVCRDFFGSSCHVKMSAGLVQRNFPSVFEMSQGVEEDTEERYSFLFSTLVHAKPDVLILPESAFCEVGAVDSPRASLFARQAMSVTGAKAVLAGGSRRSGGKLYNSAALYSRHQESRPRCSDVYDKVHLVPFGEFIPFDKVFTVLQKLAPVGSCTPGELKTLELALDASTAKLGVAICYEDTDSAQMRRLAEKGARVLVFMTNDNWFSSSVEPVQHAWQAVARAIETGLPVARVGNSGVTGTISPDGKASWLADGDGRPIVDEAGAMCARIDMPSDWTPTVYVRLGDVPLFCAFLVLLTAIGMVEYKASYEQRRKVSM